MARVKSVTKLVRQVNGQYMARPFALHFHSLFLICRIYVGSGLARVYSASVVFASVVFAYLCVCRSS